MTANQNQRTRNQRSERSKIQWTDFTFNPWIGCTKISPACANCYAERENKRFNWNPSGWGKGRPRIMTSDSNWKKPVKWDKMAASLNTRFRVFSGSLCDIFDPEVPRDWRAQFWKLVDHCRNLHWLILTKRPENFRELLPWGPASDPWMHVSLGVTAENQEMADKRIHRLLYTSAYSRFISMEPMLGPISITEVCDEWWESRFHPLWVIVGGESGPKARPFELSWARAVLKECRDNGVPFFMKQLSENQYKGNRYKQMSSFPKDLRVREFPK